MGQRSQIYVRWNANAKQHFTATYFQWCYDERLVSRARSIIEWLKENARYKEFSINERLVHYLVAVNFDMRDILNTTDLVDEFKEYGKDYTKSINDWIFNADNNNGRLLIDLRDDNTVHYAFLDYDNKYLGGAKEYLGWSMNYSHENLQQDYESIMNRFDAETKAYTIDNLDWLGNTENATVMSEEEVEEYLTADYSYLVE